MSAHPFDDDLIARQAELAAEDPDTANEMGLFEVDTLDKANRVVWRIGQLRGQLGASEALYRSERARLDEWIEHERRFVSAQVRWLEGLAQKYHRRLLAEDKRRKTVRLPAGELKARKAQDVWEILDAALVAWAEETGHEELINRPEPTVYRNAVKKAFEVKDGLAVTDDGEVVPGVTVHVAAETDVEFSVKTPGAD